MYDFFCKDTQKVCNVVILLQILTFINDSYILLFILKTHINTVFSGRIAN